MLESSVLSSAGKHLLSGHQRKQTDVKCLLTTSQIDNYLVRFVTIAILNKLEKPVCNYLGIYLFITFLRVQLFQFTYLFRFDDMESSAI